MLQFSYKLKVAERVKAKCERHPRFDPERDGRGGIKGDVARSAEIGVLRCVRWPASDRCHNGFFQHYGAGRAFIFGCGRTGVDVFFVLSGFLITGILYDSQNKVHRYSDFYVRRTLRIFPLYYFIWTVILFLAPFAHWQWNLRWALWPAYLGNYARFFFLHRQGDPYLFDKLTFGAPVSTWFGYPFHLYIGHFWSLCVEEQF